MIVKSQAKRVSAANHSFSGSTLSERVALGAGALCAALAPLTGLEVPYIGLTGLELAAALLCLIAALGISRDVREPVSYFLVSVGSWLLLVAVASSAAARDAEASLAGYATMAVALFTVGTVVAALIRVPRGPDVLMVGYTVGCVVLSLSIWILPTEIYGRYFGLATHPVEVGGTLAAGIVYMVFRVHNVKSAFVAGGLIALCVSAVLRAGAATGILAALVGVGVAAVIARRFQAAFWGAIVTTGAALFLAATAAGQSLIEKVGAQFASFPSDLSAVDYNSPNTLASRLATMKIGVERASETPIVGVGLAPDATIVLGDLNPHNVFVFAWLAGGVLLLSMYIVAVALSFYGGRLQLQGRLTVQHAPALFGAAAAAWAAAMTGPGLYQRAWLFPVLIVALLFLTRSEKRSFDPFEGRKGARPYTRGIDRLRGRAAKA